MRIRLRSRRTPTLTGTCNPGKPIARQIQPLRVQRLDQRNLFRAPPSLELFLTVDGVVDLVERFPIEQTLHSVFVGEALDPVELVFERSGVQLAGHTDIKRSRQATHEVNVVRFSLARHRRGRGPSTPVTIHFVNGHLRSG